MNRKEIAEIRKLLCMQRNPIHTIYGCYVNSEKDLLSEFKHPALSLPEDELFKYLDIFRKALAGKKEKNLTQVDFPLSEESAGGTQHFLYQFCNGTGDIQEDALEELYGIIVENYTTVENYAILVALGAYDVPGKATDGTIMDDASETTYCFIICCICPVKKTSNDLGYNEKEAIFENLVRLEKVAPPENAFLFPSFDDRASNCHSLLYYSRRDMHAEFVANGLNCQLPLWEPDQKQYFQAAVDTAFSSQYTVETSIELYQNICEKAEELEDPTISKNGLHHILEQCGATEDDLNAFDREFPDNVVLHSNSIIDTRKCTISAYGMTLKIDRDQLDLLETRNIDGQTYLCIPITNNFRVNDVEIKG